MTLVQTKQKSTSVDGVASDTSRNTIQWSPDSIMIARLMDLDKSTAYMDGVTLTELRITHRNDEWLVIVKGRRRGIPLVSFIQARTFPMALAIAGEWADGGRFRWSQDKYPPKS